MMAGEADEDEDAAALLVLEESEEERGGAAELKGGGREPGRAGVAGAPRASAPATTGGGPAMPATVVHCTC